MLFSFLSVAQALFSTWRMDIKEVGRECGRAGFPFAFGNSEARILSRLIFPFGRAPFAVQSGRKILLLSASPAG